MQVVGEGEPSRHPSFLAAAAEGGGRADLRGPAVFGLPALFSPEAVASVPGAADQTADGGDEAAALAPVEKPVEAGAGGRAGAGGKSALALTTVHLWRVECRQLFADLWRLQPEVLLHLLDQLLAGGVGDGAGDASEGGAAAAPGAAPCQQAAPGAAPLGGTTGDKDGQQERARLLRLRSKIAAVAATVDRTTRSICTTVRRVACQIKQRRLQAPAGWMTRLTKCDRPTYLCPPASGTPAVCHAPPPASAALGSPLLLTSLLCRPTLCCHACCPISCYAIHLQRRLRVCFTDNLTLRCTTSPRPQL